MCIRDSTNRASGSLALAMRARGMHWVERGSQLACAALIASHAPICALAHEPRESPAIIFHGNGSAGATGRRCRYKLAASGGSAGCVRQLQAPIWVTPIAGGYETAKNRGIFATSAHRALCSVQQFDRISSNSDATTTKGSCTVLHKYLRYRESIYIIAAHGMM